MLGAIRHGLGNLFNFEGRDARQAFWYYVLFVYLITMAIGMAVSIPMTTQAMMTGVQQGMANAGNPDRAAADAAAQAAIASSMHGYMPIMVWTGFASAAILLAGLAAAIVRRLHDADLSGYWALLPLGLQAINIALIPTQLARLEAMVAAQFTDPLAAFKLYDGVTGLGAVAGWIAIVIVIVLGTRKSTEGPNRFGEAPFVA
jgi:uncharacterized membrane protein YhaH (DUF805 family)